MTRFVARHIAPEMLALLLLEMAISFGLAYMVLTPGRVDMFQVEAANRAAVVALTVGCTSLLLGLYRPRLFMQTRSLLLTTALGGVVAFPAVWAVTSALGMSSDWIVGHDRVWPTKIMLTWIAALFAVRICFLFAVRSNLFVRRVGVAGAPADVAGAIAAVRAAPDGCFQVVASPPVRSPAALRAAGIRIALVSPAGSGTGGLYARWRRPRA